MNAVIKKIQEIKCVLSGYYTYLIYSIILIIGFYGNYIQPHYSSDAYSNWSLGYSYIIPAFLKEGRFTNTISSAILYYLFGVNPTKNQLPIMVICYFLFIIINMTTFIIIDRRIKGTSIFDKHLLFIGISMLYLNPFFCDWYQFIDVVAQFSIGLFLIVIAAYFVVKNEKFSYKNYFIGTILLILGIGSYQVLGSYYFFIALTIILIQLVIDELENTRAFYIEYFMKIFRICSAYAVSGVFNLLFIKYYAPNNDRAQLKANIGENLRGIIYEHKSLWMDNMGLMPEYLFFIITVVLFLIFIYYMIIKKRNILVTSIILLGMYSAIFISHVMLETLWISHRTITVFMGIPGILIIFIIALRKSEKNKKASSVFLKRITEVLAISLFVIYGVQTQRISNDLLKMNELTKYEVNYFVEQIEKYENENQIIVRNLGFAYDNQPSYGYADMIVNKDINVRTLYVDWSQVTSFNYISGRRFKKVDMNKKIFERNFKGKNWNNISEEQIIFDKETAYIIIY